MRRKSRAGRDARTANSVSADIDKLLAPKTYEQLETLEVQVKKKLDSDEPIDYDYWEQLLRNLRICKAKAKLRRVSQEIVRERLQALRKQQAEAAVAVQEKLREKLGGTAATTVAYDAALDPQPLLKLRAEDKGLAQMDAQVFLDELVSAAVPCSALPCPPLPTLPCPALPYPVLPCPALPCPPLPTLPCPALRLWHMVHAHAHAH
jgi:hypothetical protein